MSLVGGMGVCLGWWDPGMEVVLMVVGWLAEITFSDLTAGGHIGVLTTWNFLQDTVTKVLHKHLLFAFHI